MKLTMTLPRFHLAHLPTRVEELPRLSAHLGGPRLLIKRDDQTGLAGGGNKARKLEYLVAAALAEGAQTLITGGARQSNHCRQTAAAAARAGLGCILVLRGDPPSPGEAGGNILLDRLLGAELVWTGERPREEVMTEIFEREKTAGRRPYLIPVGGSNILGAAAYAAAIEEFMDQGVRPDRIVFASSSGGTHAGMALGARAMGYAGQIYGISVDEEAEALKSLVARLATETAAFLGLPFTFAPDDILADDDYLAGGYAVMGEAEKEAILLFARYEGILLDPVYTGRAGAGLIGLIREGEFGRGDTVMFWHTGGQPALFAQVYARQLMR